MVAAAAVAVTAVDAAAAVVVVVVTAVVVAVIAITIVTNANRAGKKRPRTYTDGHGSNLLTDLNLSVLFVKVRGYFLASGLSFKLTFSVPRITSTTYSSPAFISPSAAV